MGEWRYSSKHSLTSALDGGERQASRPGRFIASNRNPGWVGSKAGLEAVVAVTNSSILFLKDSVFHFLSYGKGNVYMNIFWSILWIIIMLISFLAKQAVKN